MGIDVQQLNDLDIGKWVKYTSFNNVEIGRIKSFGRGYIWAVFKCGNNWDEFNNYTAARCNPSDLEFTDPLPTKKKKVSIL